MNAWLSGSYRPQTLKPAFSYLNWGDKTKKWTREVGVLSEGGMEHWIGILKATHPYTQFANSGTIQAALNSDDEIEEISDEENVDYQTVAPGSGLY
jgi:hypothetical protein